MHSLRDPSHRDPTGILVPGHHYHTGINYGFEARHIMTDQAIDMHLV